MTDPRELIEKLRALSAWLLSNDIDMQMPEGMIDPADAAAYIEQTLAAVPDEVEGLVAEWQAAMKDIVARGPWRVVSDHPALAIASGDYRVVQTPNQNNHRHFGTAERWHGIESYALADWIARCSPDAIADLLDIIRAQAALIAEMRKALEPFSDAAGEYFARAFNRSDVIAQLPPRHDAPGVQITAGMLFDARRALNAGGGDGN